MKINPRWRFFIADPDDGSNFFSTCPSSCSFFASPTKANTSQATMRASPLGSPGPGQMLSGPPLQIWPIKRHSRFSLEAEPPQHFYMRHLGCLGAPRRFGERITSPNIQGYQPWDVPVTRAARAKGQKKASDELSIPSPLTWTWYGDASWHDQKGGEPKKSGNVHSKRESFSIDGHVSVTAP